MTVSWKTNLLPIKWKDTLNNLKKNHSNGYILKKKTNHTSRLAGSTGGSVVTGISHK